MKRAKHNIPNWRKNGQYKETMQSLESQIKNRNNIHKKPEPKLQYTKTTIYNNHHSNKIRKILRKKTISE